MQEQEFKVFNLEMERISVFYGLFLVAWGLVISFLSQSDSMTSYIPSFLGLWLVMFFLALCRVIHLTRVF